MEEDGQDPCGCHWYGVGKGVRERPFFEADHAIRVLSRWKLGLRSSFGTVVPAAAHPLLTQTFRVTAQRWP